MQMGHFFEAMMLVCFGFSWPLNVVKAFRARTAKGTSLAFIILIITGYVAGITAKFINHQINYVLAVYFMNLAIVMMNVVVYIRNRSLDRKRDALVAKSKIFEIQKKYKNEEVESSEEENMNYVELNAIAKQNGVILMGGSMDKEIPVAELARSFEFDFEIYNRSEEKLSVKDAKEFFETKVAPIHPEAVIIHIGDEDKLLFKNKSADFDKYFFDLISSITSLNKKTRIALVSVYNPEGSETISRMNAHIKAIADSTKTVFVNLDNVKSWNPKATKAASDFAKKMGLKVRKPLNDVAEILYSYACLEMAEPENKETLVG